MESVILTEQSKNFDQISLDLKNEKIIFNMFCSVFKTENSILYCMYLFLRFSLIFSLQFTTSNTSLRRFPDDFLFGAATSAYQVEGAWNVDGKGLSNWDEFTHSHPEKIADGQNGDIGPNSYEFFLGDIAAIESLNVI